MRGGFSYSIKVAKNFGLTNHLIDLRHVRYMGRLLEAPEMTNPGVCALRGVKFAAISLLLLAAAGCANTPTDPARAGTAPPGSQQDFVVNVGDRVFFESDSTELTAQSVATLDKQAQWLQHYSQYTFTIEGHADERGTREYNIALGARRAQTVRDYLTSHGVSAQRMRTISYGKERPVAVCKYFLLVAESARSNGAQYEFLRGNTGEGEQPAPSGAGCV
jgi:peptidoglycan-associated lipoprotein